MHQGEVNGGSGVMELRKMKVVVVVEGGEVNNRG